MKCKSCNSEIRCGEIHYPGPGPNGLCLVQHISKTRFLDELMAHIIVVGGSKIEPTRLREWNFGELIDLIWPNGIRLNVTTEKDT